jgi:Tol biopolymer transport system component
MSLNKTYVVFLVVSALLFPMNIILSQTSEGSAAPPNPPDIPAVFLPDIVSSKADEYGLAVTKDWSEIYFTRIEGDISYIFVSKWQKDSWSMPDITNFSYPGGAAHPCLSADESNIYFVSRRVCIGVNQALNVWTSRRSDTGWEEPTALGKPFTNETVHAPSVSASGTLYASGLKRFRKTDSGYMDPEELTPNINGSHPAVSPDEKLIVFSARKAGGHGGNDLCVVFSQADGSWGQPVNLGPHVNTEAVESSPTFSSDGRALFFSRKGDIWWINADIVHRLNPGSNR